jgi:glycosyltransferase involved in cell wall biosynthesis
MIQISYLVNVRKGTNTWRRATKLKTAIESLDKRISIKLVSREQLIGTDFLRFSKFLANNADFFHIFEPFLPTFPALYLFIKLFRGRPIIYDSGDVHFAVSRLSGDFLSPYYLTLKFSESLAFQLSNKIIVRGRDMKKVLEYLYRISPKRITWVPDGVDLIRFSPRDSAHIRKRLGLEDKIVIGYSSDYRPIKVKNLQLARGWELIYVSKQLINKGYKNFVVLMIGKGKAVGLLKRMALDLGVKDYVMFTGFVPEGLYPDYINATDICFYESINDISYEAMLGTKMQEYMACGKPTIAGKIGEAKYALNHAGILIKPLNPNKKEDIPRYLNDITNAIITLMNNNDLRKKLGSNARKVAEEHYDWNKIARKLHILYTSML